MNFESVLLWHFLAERLLASHPISLSLSYFVHKNGDKKYLLGRADAFMDKLKDVVLEVLFQRFLELLSPHTEACAEQSEKRHRNAVAARDISGFSKQNQL